MGENPFHINGPAAISFSGGRTSAYMLWRILQAHGGTLPTNIVAVFANTGREHEATLRFVHECGSRWGVPIHWVEWRRGTPGWELVGFNSASRDGEPFEALILSKKRLPNWQERWCTGYLKVTVMTKFMASLGYTTGSYKECIGLRKDEGLRILRGLAAGEVDGRKRVYPLANAKVERPEVDAFWRAQAFDLTIPSWQGNCDHCPMMGRELRKQRMAANPAGVQWWADMERQFGWFDRRDTFQSLFAERRREPSLFGEAIDEFDAECGDACGGAD